MFFIILVLFSYCYLDTDFSFLEVMTTSYVSTSSVMFVSKMSTSSTISKSSNTTGTNKNSLEGSGNINGTSKSLPKDSCPSASAHIY